MALATWHQVFIDRPRASAIVALACAGLLGCGGDETPTTPANSPPAISISASASFGMTQLTTFSFIAAVTEPDRNPVSVKWTFSDGSGGAGLNVWRNFAVPGTIEVTATATDHLGASTVSNVVTVTVASITGDWSGTIDLASCEAGTKPFTASLVQTGAQLTGTIRFPEGFCTSTPITAPVASDDATRLFASGAVRLHVVLPVGDGSFEGQIDNTGQQITGTVSGTEPSGVAFALTRQ